MGRLALVLVALAAILASACSSPVRLATPAEIAQANRPSPAAANAGAGDAGTGSGGAQASPAPGAAGGSGALAQLQAELRQLIAQVSPSVVEVDADSRVGSGVIFDSQGSIVTNAHIVDGARTVNIRTADGRTLAATVRGSNAASDLAVIRVAPDGLKAATFGDSGQVQVGDVVVAIGSPAGTSGSLSQGIVSGLKGSVQTGSGMTLANLLETTAAIGPGGSGGALVNIAGQVIGILTLGANSSAGTAAGVAIPSSQAAAVAKQLIGTSPATQSASAYLGVATTSAPGGGALVASVVAGGPAAKAGVAAGWVITGIGGHQVADSNAVLQALAGFKAGDHVALTARLPDGSSRTVQVTLGQRPAPTPTP
jgi:S1-C subfamily serine protease